jgi:SOS response regulatory protein OraA/RecX
VSGKGKRALKFDLVKRGADDKAIESVLAEYDEDVDGAYYVLEKYFNGKTLDKNTLYKGVKYLLSKGYSYETAKEAVEKFGDTDEDY